MKKTPFLFLWLQFKSAFLLLPKLFFTLFASLFLAGGIYFAGTEILKKPDSIKLPIALVLPEHDTYAQMAFTFLEHSVKDICSFTQTDKEHAISLLKSKNVYAIILVPDNFIEHILNGTNSAATLLLPKENSLESILFCTLANAGVSYLSTAQAGIYAAEDTLISYEKWESLAKVQEELNKRYLSYPLNRNKVFQTKTISATGSLSLANYYICSGVVLLSLLTGISQYHYFRAESKELLLLLNRQGLSFFFLLLSKLLAITGIYVLLFFPILVFAKLLPIASLGGFFIYTFTIQSFLLLLSTICPQPGNYSTLSAFLSILFLFLSGAFIPSVFLPEPLRQLGHFLPSALFIKLFQELLTHTFSLLSALQGILIGILFLLLSTFLYKNQKGALL